MFSRFGTCYMDSCCLVVMMQQWRLRSTLASICLRRQPDLKIISRGPTHRMSQIINSKIQPLESTLALVAHLMRINVACKVTNQWSISYKKWTGMRGLLDLSLPIMLTRMASATRTTNRQLQILVDCLALWCKTLSSEKLYAGLTTNVRVRTFRTKFVTSIGQTPISYWEKALMVAKLVWLQLQVHAYQPRSKKTHFIWSWLWWTRKRWTIVGSKSLNWHCGQSTDWIKCVSTLRRTNYLTAKFGKQIIKFATTVTTTNSNPNNRKSAKNTDSQYTRPDDS